MSTARRRERQEPPPHRPVAARTLPHKLHFSSSRPCRHLLVRNRQKSPLPNQTAPNSHPRKTPRMRVAARAGRLPLVPLAPPRHQLRGRLPAPILLPLLRGLHWMPNPWLMQDPEVTSRSGPGLRLHEKASAYSRPKLKSPVSSRGSASPAKSSTSTSSCGATDMRSYRVREDDDPRDLTRRRSDSPEEDRPARRQDRKEVIKKKEPGVWQICNGHQTEGHGVIGQGIC